MPKPDAAFMRPALRASCLLYTSWKKYKITPEDWRNRDKRRDYLVAADEMFARTSTDYAPWHIVAAEDKKCARLEEMCIRDRTAALAGISYSVSRRTSGLTVQLTRAG